MTNNIVKKIVILLILLSTFNNTDALCQATERNLKGQVISGQKAPLKSANIVLLNQDNKDVLRTFSDSLGQFNIAYSGSAEGKYTLQVSYAGHKEYISEIFNLSDKDFGIIELVTSSQSQPTAKILQGRIVDDNKAPLTFANIALLNKDDKSIFRAYSDSLGQFKMSYPVGGKYTLQVSYSGYKDFKSEAFDLHNKDFGVIALIPSIQNLKEVVIQGKSDLITIEPNSIVYNVARSIDAQGVSAFEALRKAPGVYIDNDKSITLNGKQGTMILIDGKQTYLSGPELIDLLKSMPSSSIKTFEMINSPSAKYDASGAAGMINIRTTKSQIKGFNGTLTSGLTYGMTVKHVQDISFNYRKNKYNLFGNYNHFLGYRSYIYGSDRIQEGKTYDSNTDDTDKRKNMGSRLGFDYDINKKNTIGVLLNASSIFGGGLTQTKTNISQGSSTLVDQVLDAANDYYYQKTMRYAANLNYKYEDTVGRIINFDLDYGTFDKGNANRQSNTYTTNQNVSVR